MKKVTEIWIPHLSKVRANLLPPESDLSDPPLTAESMAKAIKLMDEIAEKYGPPVAIFTSPKQRARQTIEPAVKRFGQHHDGGCVVIGLNTLSQPDNADPAEKDDPRADGKGLIYYGPRSYSPDWYGWFLASRRVIEAVSKAFHANGPIYISTHRPFVGAARWVVKHGLTLPGRDDIDALDPSLLPYIVIEKENGRLIEIPRK